MPDHVQPYGGKQALLTHESSHDTFNSDNFLNWLENGAGVGIFAHGRVHQQIDRDIYVGDLIHKRGHATPEDILLMEEQALLSTGDPLTVPSRLGVLKALAVLPTMNTANGEGSLVAYYQNGVVSFDTFEAPRESRYDGEGAQITKGWDSKRLVNHLLNTVSAVGHRAVSVLTRDHLFRSLRGLHFLKTVLGEGTFNSENINTVSSDVAPVLDSDPVNLLEGSATGFWLFGNRMFATTGMVQSSASLPSGRGFVSWNQATTFTEDRTPRPAWEGVWVVDSGIEGIHQFVETREIPDKTSFGFVCSDRDQGVRVATLDRTAANDTRDGNVVPIGWSLETGRYAPEGLGSLKSVNDCVVEGVYQTSSQEVRVYLRTDANSEWTLWRRFSPATEAKAATGAFRLSTSLGKPPTGAREGTWFQLRIEGLGSVEITLIELDYSPVTMKSGRQSWSSADFPEEDIFKTNNP